MKLTHYEVLCEIPQEIFVENVKQNFTGKGLQCEWMTVDEVEIQVYGYGRILIDSELIR
jgi:hypothetical protein